MAIMTSWRALPATSGFAGAAPLNGSIAKQEATPAILVWISHMG